MRMSQEDAMMHRCFGGLLTIMVMGVPSSVLGQSQEEFHHIILSAGAGFPASTVPMAGTLDHGANIQLNGGYFFDRHFGITTNFMFSDMGITRATLNDLNEPIGKATVYAVTADPTVRIPLGRGFSAYTLAGGGYMRRSGKFTTLIVIETIRHNWHVYTATGDMVMGTIIDNSCGFDAGGGFNMPWPERSAEVFLGTHYLKGFTSNLNTTVVPITFGFRW
jgi:hypothetical protein